MHVLNALGYMLLTRSLRRIAIDTCCRRVLTDLTPYFFGFFSGGFCGRNYFVIEEMNEWSWRRISYTEVKDLIKILLILLRIEIFYRKSLIRSIWERIIVLLYLQGLKYIMQNGVSPCNRNSTRSTRRIKKRRENEMNQMGRSIREEERSFHQEGFLAISTTILLPFPILLLVYVTGVNSQTSVYEDLYVCESMDTPISTNSCRLVSFFKQEKVSVCLQRCEKNSLRYAE